MRNLLLVAMLAIGGLMAVGCGGPPEDANAPAVAGEPPPIKQAEPGMLTPEERARQGTQGQEAGDGG